MALKRILLAIGALVILLVIVEIVGLLELKANINRFASYWQQRQQQPGEFTYVALGDSAAQGLGASAADKGYVGLLANQLTSATGKSVRVINLSVTGAQIDDVINKQLPELNNYKPDLVTVEIGANNVTHWNETEFSAQYSQLAAALPKGTIVSNIPYFGGRIRLNSTAIVASQIIEGIAKKDGLKVVDLQTYTREHQSLLNYAPDLFHPNNRGYKNWAAAFWQVIEPTLSSRQS